MIFRDMVIADNASRFTDLACSVCEKKYSSRILQTYSTCDVCGKAPLIANYTLEKCSPSNLIERNKGGMWRYFSLMPVCDADNVVSLGEGWTPILQLQRTAANLGLECLLTKDESLNPTGSFKARGMSVAISKAKEFGVKKCIAPSAGNAGVALAAYAARANMEVTVVMPTITPKEFVKECSLYGAEVILENGLIDKCAAKVAQINHKGEYFDFSTMKEPYRLEGKKTIGYEIAEQLNWELPNVILYPTGGGTGLIGIWKAFHEMKKMGWIKAKFPRMIAVQSARCAPVVKAFNSDHSFVADSSIAYGLNVPKPFAMRMILGVIAESHGDTIAVEEEEILSNTKQLIKNEGTFVSPEGGALLAALKRLLNQGKIQRNERVLVINTGSGGKYLSCFN